MSNQLPFRISSALKNIIGKELITDEFVAIFELVKNSFDANSKKVEVIFENQTDLSKGKIIIKDNGKGMNEDDFKKKWLFVAYSAKKDGTENDDDYRNRIKVNRVFAGAKGVGRFSCDRLGKHLSLTSVKDEKGATIQNLVVNWEDFETDPLKEFINVKVRLQSQGKSSIPGTTLEISSLRDVWDRHKLLKLKKSLAKLINPNQDNDSNNFQIEIIAKSELAEDKKTSIEYDKVNGLIKNDVFENLKIKTTSLKVTIPKDGKTIVSVLQDRGDRIYTLTEKNPFKDLHSIGCSLFQLNFNAKLAFKNAMGVRSLDYGSVFMYKNGFRIYPFGEPGEDLLLIDRRKGQGYNRFLGNRDIIGRIEINGRQDELRETSSRDGGLVKTATYVQLVRFFEDFVLKRLENYVVNVIKWGDAKKDEVTGEIIQPELWAKDVKIQILELITGFIKSDTVIDIDYDKNFLEIIESKQDKSVDKIIKNISKIGAKSNNPAIVKEAARIGKVVKEVKEDAERDKKRADKETALRIEKEEELFTEKLKSEFYKKQTTKDTDALIHHIKNNNISIKKATENIIEDIKSGSLDDDTLLKDLSYILLHTNKAIKAAELITHVDLAESDAQDVELSSFLEGYVANYQQINSRHKCKIKYHHKGGIFKALLSKTELAIVIDNLEDNAAKWGARNILIQSRVDGGNKFVISFSDDGKGLSKKYLDDPKQVFKFKETGSKGGTGLGLYVVKEILERMGANIKFIDNGISLAGATFEIIFSRVK